MPRMTIQLSCILCVLGAISCASADPQSSNLNNDDNTARILKSEAVLPDQISNEMNVNAAPSLMVDQIDPGATNTDYGFSDVKGDDPCLDPATSATARCQPGLLDRASLTDGNERNSETALKELQSIVPNVIDPNSFDAERTADEIGRSGGSLQSQASMALGAEFLAPPVELEAESEPELDRPGGIPPFSPDFIPPPRTPS